MSESVNPFSKLYDLTQRAEKVGISDDDVLREILVEKIVPNKYQPRREFTEEKIRNSTINIGIKANINLCRKIDHGCSLYASKLEWPSNVNNAKKQTMGNSIKSKTIFFHLSFFCSI